MEKNKPNIIIIDSSSDISRPENMTKAFKTLANVCLYSFSENRLKIDKKRDGVWQPFEENDTSFLLTLIHGGDNAYKNRFKNGGQKIWYGGNDGKDSRADSRDYQIKRKIVNRDHLSPEEAQELILFVQNKIPKPSFLLSPDFEEGLQVAIDIYHSLIGLEDIDNLDIYEGQVVEFDYLKEPWATLRKDIETCLQAKGEIRPFDRDYMAIMDKFQQTINKINL